MLIIQLKIDPIGLILSYSNYGDQLCMYCPLFLNFQEI